MYDESLAVTNEAPRVRTTQQQALLTFISESHTYSVRIGAALVTLATFPSWGSWPEWRHARSRTSLARRSRVTDNRGMSPIRMPRWSVRVRILAAILMVSATGMIVAGGTE